MNFQRFFLILFLIVCVPPLARAQTKCFNPAAYMRELMKKGPLTQFSTLVDLEFSPDTPLSTQKSYIDQINFEKTEVKPKEAPKYEQTNCSKVPMENDSHLYKISILSYSENYLVLDPQALNAAQKNPESSKILSMYIMKSLNGNSVQVIMKMKLPIPNYIECGSAKSTVLATVLLSFGVDQKPDPQALIYPHLKQLFQSLKDVKRCSYSTSAFTRKACETKVPTDEINSDVRQIFYKNSVHYKVTPEGYQIIPEETGSAHNRAAFEIQKQYQAKLLYHSEEPMFCTAGAITDPHDVNNLKIYLGASSIEKLTRDIVIHEATHLNFSTPTTNGGFDSIFFGHLSKKIPKEGWGYETFSLDEIPAYVHGLETVILDKAKYPNEEWQSLMTPSYGNLLELTDRAARESLEISKKISILLNSPNSAIEVNRNRESVIELLTGITNLGWGNWSKERNTVFIEIFGKEETLRMPLFAADLFEAVKALDWGLPLNTYTFSWTGPIPANYMQWRRKMLALALERTQIMSVNLRKINSLYKGMFYNGDYVSDAYLAQISQMGIQILKDLEHYKPLQPVPPPWNPTSVEAFKNSGE
jgi:hypothetical protein